MNTSTLSAVGQVDPYNTQSAIALLRQHMEYEHTYDLAKLSLKNISNTQVRLEADSSMATCLPVNVAYLAQGCVCRIVFCQGKGLVTPTI